MADPRLPNFLVVGAAKAGTSSLYRYLASHPDVFMSPVKEPHYFTTLEPRPPEHVMRRFVRTPEAYAKLFGGAGREAAVGEASPSYLWCTDAAARIAETLEDVRIVAVLRDPAARAHSHYLMDVREGAQDLPFREALRRDYAAHPKGWHVSHLYVELGLYAEQLERYYARFGRDRVLVLFFDDLVADPRALTAKVLTFLGVDPARLPEGATAGVDNEFRAARGAWAQGLMRSRAVRGGIGGLVPAGVRSWVRERVLMRGAPKPAIEPQAAAYLADLFEVEDRRLAELLGVAPPWARME